VDELWETTTATALVTLVSEAAAWWRLPSPNGTVTPEVETSRQRAADSTTPELDTTKAPSSIESSRIVPRISGLVISFCSSE
jgi:hypothetical protein